MIRHFFSALRISGLALAALVVSASMASAGPNDVTAPVWLASLTGDPAIGRLVIRDGMLTFATAQAEWQVALSDIKSVTIAKGDDRSLDIQTVTGNRLRLTIRSSPQLLVAAPKPVVQRIQRAVKEAPSTRRPLLASAAPDSHER